jgi:hypothetical protein
VATVLSFGPYYWVRGRLPGRILVQWYHQELRPRKAWGMTLRYDERAVLLLLLPNAPAAGLTWGEIQRASLSLAQVIDAGVAG